MSEPKEHSLTILPEAGYKVGRDEFAQVYIAAAVAGLEIDRVEWSITPYTARVCVKNNDSLTAASWSRLFDAMNALDDFRFRTSFAHYRYPASLQLPDQGPPDIGTARRYRRGREPWAPHPRGGVTVCEVDIQEPGSNIWRTYSALGRCSYSDNFSYERGRHWSLKHTADAVVAHPPPALAEALGLEKDTGPRVERLNQEMVWEEVKEIDWDEVVTALEEGRPYGDPAFIGMDPAAGPDEGGYVFWPPFSWRKIEDEATVDARPPVAQLVERMEKLDERIERLEQRFGPPPGPPR